MAWLTACVLVCILTAALAAPPVAAQPRTAELDAYLALLGRYESGDYDRAANAALTLDLDTARTLARLMLDDTENEMLRLQRLSSSSRAVVPTRGLLDQLRGERVRRLKLTLLVHTEAALRVTAPTPLDRQLTIAREAVARLRSLEEDYKVNGPLSDHDELYGGIAAERPALTPAARTRLGRLEWEALKLLTRDWYLVVVSHLQSVGHLGLLKSHVTAGLKFFSDDPELLLARGAISEGEADVAVIDRSLASEIYVSDFVQQWRRFMSAAGADYQEAARRQPDLLEATLRWGRINSHLGNRKEARRALEDVATSTAPASLRYLAHLFLGELAEREQQPDLARPAYEASLRVFPSAQAPMLTLSRLCDAAAQPDCARRWLAQSMAAAVPGRLDPWWDYQRGQAWLGDARLAKFRARGLRK